MGSLLPFKMALWQCICNAQTIHIYVNAQTTSQADALPVANVMLHVR